MKHRRLCLFVAMLLTSLCSFAQFSGSGSGTESDPYLIYNETQLSQMANFLNQEGVVFSLKKDLDLTSWIAENSPSQGWQPIGVEGSPFKGKLIGNGKTISSLSINRGSTRRVGFFGYIEGATISNLTIQGTTISGGQDTGVLAGNAKNSTLTNVSVKVTSISGGNRCGGMMGTAVGITLTNANVEATSFSGGYDCGGMIGYSSSTNVTTFSVKISSTTASSVRKGGIMGYAYGCSITDGSVDGNFLGKSQVGGAVGYAPGTLTLKNVTVNGRCSGSSSSIGGLVGEASATTTLTSCNHNGDVDGNASVGGLIGNLKNGSRATLTDCKSKGKITNTAQYTGGLIGVSEGACIAGIENCSHFGEIQGKDYVGGLVGAILQRDFEPEFHDNYEVWSDYSYDYSIGGTATATKLDGSTVSVDVYTGRGTKYSSGGKDVYHSDKTEKEKIKLNINNCAAIGNITGTNYVGGLIGFDNPSYSSAYVKEIKSTSTTVSVPSKYHLIFKNSAIKEQYLTKNSYNSTSYSSSYIITYYYNVYAPVYTTYALNNSYYSGDINAGEYVGGVVGQKLAGDINNCYAYGRVYGSNYVGGIVGRIYDPNSQKNVTTIKASVANCPTISATASNAIVGRIYGAKTANTVIGSTGSSDGNLGLTTCKLIKSGVTQTISDDAQNGQNVGPSLLRLKATYVAKGWDFDNDWKILETECYPYKKFQAAPPVFSSDLVSGATSISGQSIDGGTVYVKYKDNEPIANKCTGNMWSITTEPLQSGAQVQAYADVEGLTPSYYTTASVGFLGSGTQEDPYCIYTAEDLQGAAKRGYYKLMNDIDLTSWIAANSPTKGWVPIGLNSGDGTYIDGDNHKVTGLWTNTTGDYVGLFSNYSAGEIKNLNVEVAKGKKVKGGSYAGILIGRMASGKISNCTVKGDVEGTQYVGGIAGYTKSTPLSLLEANGSVKGTDYVGGLAGYVDGQTDHCTSNSTVTASGNCAGGLIAFSTGNISNSNATATITSTGASAYVGGLVGYTYSTVTKSSANANITASGESNIVGGLVGRTSRAVTLSFSSGTVSASGSESQTGGLVGKAESTSIVNCYSTANVAGTKYNAGLVAYALNTTIDKCYAKGDINGVDYGGGVVAQLDGASAALTNSVAINKTLSLTASAAWGSRVIGGYKNGAADPEDSNYALSTMQVSLNGIAQKKTDDPVEGIAKPAADLMTAATYQGIGWDFSSVWGIDDGEIYPYLLWEIDINPVVEITLDKEQLIIAVGNTETLTASILPQGATNKHLNWTSSNTDVVTVNNGEVTAVAEGSAIITVAATDGTGVSATCEVTVVANKDAAIAQLQSIVDDAQALYDNSVEGDNIGEYASGSRAALLAAINSVKAKISSTMSDETISECTAEINAAVAQFKSQQVTAGEDTDYSQIENTIYLERAEAAAGGQLQLSVKMKNTIEVQGYQFDIYLPEGVSFATDEDGFALAELSTERTTTKKMNSFDSAIQSDGALRILCGSSKGYTFDGTDGEVALITLNISPDIDEGEYPIILKNVKLSDRNSVPYSTPYLKSTLVISSYTLGDVNADNSIDVADYIAVANYILGEEPAKFVHKAADINVDNSIDVADYIGVANLILSGAGVAHAPRPIRLMTNAPMKAPTDISAMENAIYVEPLTAVPGSQQELSICMKNAVNVAGFEFNLRLPDGITVALDEDDMPLAELSTERTTTRRTTSFDSAIQDDGTLKVLCGTTAKNTATGKLYTFEGTDGEVARITVNIPAGFAEGVYDVDIVGGMFADPDAVKTTLEPVITSELTISDGSVVLDENSETIPASTASDVNIKVKRTIKAEMWSTICLPFDMTQNQLYDAFGTDVKLAEFDSYDAEYDADDNVTSITINFSDADLTEGLYANYPYMIKTSADISEFSATATITPDEENAVAEYDNGKTGKRREVYGTFYGTYRANTYVPEGCLFVGSGNSFWYSTGSTKMKAFRAYFDLTDVLQAYYDGSEANVRMLINSETTGIQNLTQGEVTTPTYDLQGRRILRPTKGIYITNSKKIFIK